jgi:hypothetical protein
MAAAEAPEWIVREDATLPVLVALYLRQVLGIRFPEELPHLRGIPPRSAPISEYDDRSAIERQWRAYWDLTVEPQANLPVPLELIDGFETVVALPVEGFDELADAIAPTGGCRGLRPRRASALPVASGNGSVVPRLRQRDRRARARRGAAGALVRAQRPGAAVHAARRLVDRALTIAVTDGLRGDIAAFDAAVAPIIADIA